MSATGEGYSFAAASSDSYLLNQRGLADCYGGYEILARGRGSFPELPRSTDLEKSWLPYTPGVS